MDPLTIGLMSAGIPMLAGMFMGAPGAPSAPNYNPSLNLMNSPEIQGYRDQMMQGAFNPNSQLYQIAGQQALANVNRSMAQRGLGNSGLAMNMMSQSQSDLANKFLESESQRRINAFNSATGQAGQAANMYAQDATNQYNNQMLQYNGQMQRQGQFVNSLSSGLNAGMSAYQYNNMLNNMSQYNQPSLNSGYNNAYNQVSNAQPFSYNSPVFGKF